MTLLFNVFRAFLSVPYDGIATKRVRSSLSLCSSTLSAILALLALILTYTFEAMRRGWCIRKVKTWIAPERVVDLVRETTINFKVGLSPFAGSDVTKSSRRRPSRHDEIWPSSDDAPHYGIFEEAPKG